MTESNIEHDEYLQVWSLDAVSALACFGLSEDEYEVTVLQGNPVTERERAKYRPTAKLFGIRRRSTSDPARGLDVDADGSTEVGP